jgi:hypothetical protein
VKVSIEHTQQHVERDLQEEGTQTEEVGEEEERQSLHPMVEGVEEEDYQNCFGW